MVKMAKIDNISKWPTFVKMTQNGPNLEVVQMAQIPKLAKMDNISSWPKMVTILEWSKMSQMAQISM